MRPPFERQTGEGACALGAGSPEHRSQCCLLYVSVPYLEVEGVNSVTRESGCSGQFALGSVDWRVGLQRGESSFLGSSMNFTTHTLCDPRQVLNFSEPLFSHYSSKDNYRTHLTGVFKESQSEGTVEF